MAPKARASLRVDEDVACTDDPVCKDATPQAEEPAEQGSDSDDEDDDPASHSEASRHSSFVTGLTHCEGYLTKAPEEQGLFRYSRKRWFVLEDATVSYYVSEASSQLAAAPKAKALKGQFSLKGMNHVPKAKPADGVFKFDLGNWKTTTKGKPRVYTLTADTQEQFDMWIKTLSAVGAGPFSWDDVNEKELSGRIKTMSQISVDEEFA